MLEFKIHANLRDSDVEKKFMADAYDYISDSGFVDFSVDQNFLFAKKSWLSGSVVGNLAALSMFHKIIITTSDNRATILLGTSRTFIIMVSAIATMVLIGFWWLPLWQRAIVAITLSLLVYAISVSIALGRAKFIFQHIARQESW